MVVLLQINRLTDWVVKLKNIVRLKNGNGMRGWCWLLVLAAGCWLFDELVVGCWFSRARQILNHIGI